MTTGSISQDYLKKIIHYNPDTGIFTWITAPSGPVRAGSIAGNIYPGGYNRIQINGKAYQSHRLAWLYMYGEWPDDQIDHINHNRVDNRLSNLRAVSNTDNKHNKTLYSNNKSGLVGVCWKNKQKFWRAVITIKYNTIHLYAGGDFFEACCARKSAEIQHGFHPNHGNPAHL